jgi:RHS repeat-associated protein
MSDDGDIVAIGDPIYDAFGRMVFSAQGNGGTASRFYNPLTQWLEKLSYQDSNSQEWAAVDYTYDENGNVLEESRTTYESQLTLKQHTYDALDRLASSSQETPLLGLWQEGMAYTPGGNILQTATVPGSPSDFFYDSAKNVQAVTRRSAMTPRGLATNVYNYDDDGDLTSVEFRIGRSGFVLIENNFDALGMLAQTVSGYVVDDDPPARVTSVRSMGDQRVFRKYETGLGIERVIDLFDLVEIRPDENAFVVRLPLNGTTTLEDVRDLATGQRDLARSRYVHTDLRGSILATSSMSGPQVLAMEEAEYSAWGESIDIGGLAMPKHRFLDEQPDPEFGYYHFGRRVYDPGLHRWLSPDPLVLIEPRIDESNGQNLNLYSYSENNPVALKDVSGNYPSGAMEEHVQKNRESMEAHSQIYFAVIASLTPDETDAVLASAGLLDGPQPGPADLFAVGAIVTRKGDNAIRAAVNALGEVGDARRTVNSLEQAVETTASSTGRGSKAATGSIRNNPEQAALIDMAKRDKKTGITPGDAQAYKDLGKEAGVPVRGPEDHPERPQGKDPHIHVGTVDHIPVEPEEL